MQIYGALAGRNPNPARLKRGDVYRRTLKDGVYAYYICVEDNERPRNAKLRLANLENGYFCESAEQDFSLINVSTYVHMQAGECC